MRKEPRVLGFDEFADELLREKQPRALVILASAKIDTQLGQVIEKFILPKTAKPKDQDELLDGDNPLSTLSARIKVCRRLGLLDDALASALDRLRSIRNLAAHWISFGLTDASLRDQCKHLQTLVKGRRSYRLTVERFFFDIEIGEFEELQATLLTICVLVESITQKVKARAVKKSFKLPKLD